MLLVLALPSVARGEEPAAPPEDAPVAEPEPPHYTVHPVTSAELADGTKAGPGCYLVEPDCIAMAKEHKALRETLEVYKMEPGKRGMPWLEVSIIAAVAAGAGLGLGLLIAN